MHVKDKGICQCDTSFLYKRGGEDRYAHGGAVYLQSSQVNKAGGVFNMYGGELYDNEATQGGAVYLHEKNIISCVKDYFHKQGYFECEKQGMDIDNTLAETYLLCYKHLSQFVIGTSFYSFCRKRAKWTFNNHYRKFCVERDNLCLNEYNNF